MFRCRPSKRRDHPGRGYHHGDLRATLLAAAEAIIAERGVAGFSLREAARRAGVSHAAPAHHFGDARGLITELAADGFDRLAAAMRAEADAAPAEPPARRKAIGLGYIRFALGNPTLFRLMFHSDAVDRGSARLEAAGDGAFRMLQAATGAAPVPPPTAPAPDWPGLILNWSVVHGFATLAIEGPLTHGAPGPLDDARLLQLADAVLSRLETRSPVGS